MECRGKRTLPRSSWIGLVFLTLAGASSLLAAEITGKVRDATADSATVVIDGDALPAVGDRAEIFFKIPGVDEEVSVASGSVLKVDGESIQIKIEKATGDVAKDHLVRIISDKPQKPAAAQPTVSPRPTQPPPPPVAPPAPASVVSSTPTPAVAVTTPTPAAAIPAPAPSGRDPSFAFVDMDKIFKYHPRTKAAEERINRQKAVAKKEYDERVARKEPETELKEWRTAQEKALQAEALKTRNELVGEITASMRPLGAQNVNLVFDSTGPSLNKIPVVLLFPPASDMSARVSASLQGQSASQFDGARSLKIGLVDMDYVFKGLRKTKEAEDKINAAKNVAKKEYDRRADRYKRLLAEVEKLNQALAAPDAARKSARERERAAKIASLKKMESEINAWRVAQENELQSQAQKLRDSLIVEMRNAIAGLAAGQAPALILDASGKSLAGVCPFVLSSSGIPNLSDEIIAALNIPSTKSKSDSAPLVSSTNLRFAIADSKRIYEALPEAQQSQPTAEAKQAAGERIKRAVRQVAEKEGLNIVLDATGETLNGIPVLTSTHEVPDVTDAVIAALKASSG
jgi:Skp family chaperone for outer membrane proteins